jgi:hypothetical protein
LREENNLAVCVGGEDGVDIGCVVCDAVTEDWEAGDGFYVDELVQSVLFVGGGSYGEVFAV